MRGLLTKDLCLIMKQKTTLFIWFAMAVFFVVVNQDAFFGVSYSMLLMTILIIGTISYDDHDNGMGFLMTLPISRRDYAVEKYVLVLLGTFVAGVVATALGAAYILISQNGAALDELLIAAATMFCMSVLFSSLMIPVQLKFGAEKGRIFMLIFAGIIFLVAMMLGKAEGIMFLLMVTVSRISPVMILGASCVLMVLVVWVSMRVSVRIVKKEEY